MGVWAKVVGIALGVGGAAWGVKEMRLAAAVSDTPVTLTCSQLGESGSPSNAHVVLKDFLVTPNMVYEEKRGKWTQIWVPAVPLDGEYAKQLKAAIEATSKLPPVPRPIKVILTSKDVPDEKAFDALGEKDQVEGLVINVIEKIEGETRTLLEKSYGDVSGAQILEVGRKPTSSILAGLATLGGGGVALAILASFFRRKKAPVIVADGSPAA